MKTASLLNGDQLQAIFSNLDELIEVNNRFADILQDALELANEQGDEVTLIIVNSCLSNHLLLKFTLLSASSGYTIGRLQFTQLLTSVNVIPISVSFWYTV